MGFDWKKALGGVAPALTKALSGNFPGAAAAAVGALSRALLGHEKGSADDVAEVLAAGATPELIEKIQAAEREFTLKLVDSAVRLEEIEADDRANARSREIATHDWVVKALAIGVFVLFSAVVWMLYHVEIPAMNRDATNQVLGILYAAVSMVLGYYFGSSSSSRAKDAVLGRIAGR